MEESSSSPSEGPGPLNSSDSFFRLEGSNSANSSDSFFRIKSSPESVGAVEDQGDELQVNLPENERHKKVLIKELMPGGNKIDISELKMIACHSNYSFASTLRENYAGGDDITEEEGNDWLVHVLWPWPRYRTRYMADQLQLDPRKLSWTAFSEQLQEICVEKLPLETTGYLLVKNDQNAADKTENKLRIIFRDVARPYGMNNPDIIRDIDWHWIDNFRSFLWIVHTFWASWRIIESLDPDMVNDFNMVLEPSVSLHPVYSVDCFDEKNESIEIPHYLSLGPLQRAINRWAEEELGENESVNDESELGENESANDEPGGEDSIVNIEEPEIINKDDENDELVVDGKVSLKRKMNERDEEVVDDTDLAEKDEEDSQEAKNFLQRVTKVVILRQKRSVH